jgi:hypothetical protein
VFELPRRIRVLVAFGPHSGGAGKPTQAEIDHYLGIIEVLRPEKAFQSFTARRPAWAEAYDGKSVYMFNLINFFPKLQTFHGAPEFKGTPEQANTHYERSLMWLWLSHASYPTFIGVPQVRNLVNMEPGEPCKLIVVRYPMAAFLKPPPHLCASRTLRFIVAGSRPGAGFAGNGRP